MSADAERIPCRLCGESATRRFEGTVLGRHRTGYYVCPGCGLTETRDPDWLDEAYAEAISTTDTGLLARNLSLRSRVGTFLHLSGVGDRPCVDWAGGYGVFARLMRDAGFAFHWTDPHARNLFAEGFEWDDAMPPPFAVTAFEVLEHLPRPLESFRVITALGAEFVITSTELVRGEAPDPAWWYLSPESGQHVAFYQPRTLVRLGRETGYPHVITGRYWQVFARRPFPSWRWSLATRLGPLLFPLVRRTRRSLTIADHETRVRALRGG
ncbi:MAG: methyltransferase domain-containing protein [Candidatus Eisenbacteria bacterium]